MKPPITVGVHIDAPIEKIWEYWTEPEHIKNWSFASNDWWAPRAENNLYVGGTFKTRMEAKDGSEGFDIEGTYTTVEEHKKIEYTLNDGRKVRIEFIPENTGYKLSETFDPEDVNSPEIQKSGWQAIVNNFKKLVEA
jgi:uncharacterized protein YndB with AHSA1/START domain